MLRIKENRLIKWVVEEAMQKNGTWQKVLEISLVELGWGGVKGVELESVDDRDQNDVKRQCMEEHFC